MEIHERIKSLLDRSEEMEYGDAKVDVLKEAVKLADTSQDEALGFKARVYLMDTAVHSGCPELALIHFPWLESCYNRNPNQYELGMINWMYSWTAILMAYSANIPRKDIEAVMVRMEQTFRQQGKSERVILETYRTVATQLGDFELAKSFHADFERTAYPGELAMLFGLVNHRATEMHNESYYWGRIGETQKALNTVMPVLNGSIVYYPVLPTAIASALLLFIKLGIPEQAEPHFQKGLKTIRRQRIHKNLYPDYLMYATLKGNFTLGLEMVEEMVPWLENSAISNEQLEHCMACRLLFDCLMQEGLVEIRLKLPSGHPLYRPTEVYSLTNLIDYWANKGLALAQRFDERNRNTVISDYFKESLSFSQFAFRLP